MTSDRSELRFVTVVCKVCRTRLDERAAQQPRQVKCPVCFTELVVPASGEAPSTGHASHTRPSGEGYELLTPDDPAAATKREKANRFVLVVCPICRARLHADPRPEPHSLNCPDCGELVRVPSKAEARAAGKLASPPARPARPAPATPEIPLPAPATTSASLQLEQGLWRLARISQIRRVPDAKPPRSLYFSETFTFPWRRGFWSRWAWMSLGFSLIGLIASVTWYVYQTTGGYAGVVLAFFGLPLIWIVLWTCSFAAAVAQIVIVETAAGVPEVAGWDEHPFRDWIIDLFFVMYWFSAAAALALGPAWLIQLTGGSLQTSRVSHAALTAILFPIVALSALERGARWNFVSPLVLGSLVRRPAPWLGFYVLMTLLTGASGFLAHLAFPRWPTATLLISGMVIAAMVLIGARLLGRLGWAICQPKKSGRRRRPGMDRAPG